MVLRAASGSSFHTVTGSRFDCKMNVPPRTSPRSGFECVRQWVDQEWPFAESLLIAGKPGSNGR